MFSKTINFLQNSLEKDQPLKERKRSSSILINSFIRIITVLNLGIRILIIMINTKNPELRRRSINRAVYYALWDLGGVYIKFLQHLSSSSEFFQGWGEHLKNKSYEQVDTDYIDIKKYLRGQLGELADQIELESLEPFAAGSFAQVYLATINKQKVVIKILRPGLRKRLWLDLLVISQIARVINSVAASNMFDFRDTFGQFAHISRQETNYLQEVACARWFYEYYKNSEEIYIPKTHEYLCTSSLIVQEFIEGYSFAEILEMKDSGKDIVAMFEQAYGFNVTDKIKLLAYHILMSTVAAEYIHADPHPGNFKMMPNGKIGYIDFGINARPPSNKDAYLTMIYAYHKFYAGNMDYELFTKSFFRFFLPDLFEALEVFSQKHIMPKYNFDLMTKLSNIIEKKVNDENTRSNKVEQLTQREKKFGALFNQVINQQNRLGIKMKLESFALVKTVNLALNMLKSMGLPMEDMSDIFGNVHNYYRKNDIVTVWEPVMSSMKAAEIVVGWLNNLATTNSDIFQELTGPIVIKRLRDLQESSL
jgi:serine/threonine protein kinase